MEEAPENGKESPHSAHANGLIDIESITSAFGWYIPSIVRSSLGFLTYLLNVSSEPLDYSAAVN
jgi:hypothetical protein